MRRCVLVAMVLGTMAGLLAPVAAAAGAPPAHARRALLAFYTADPQDVVAYARPHRRGRPHDAFLRFLDRQPGLRPGLWSSVQGTYRRQQVLLDVSQGSRQPTGLYTDVDIDHDGAIDGLRFSGADRRFADWPSLRRRARDVSSTLRPGLLADSLTEGAGFAGVLGEPVLPAVAAADQEGRVAARTTGSVGSLARRARALNRRQRVVVVSIPATVAGRAQLASLARRRDPGQLLMVVQLPRTPARGVIGRTPGRLLRQPAFAVADGRGGSPTSPSTRRPGLVTSIDIAPTLLRWVGVRPPDRMRGEPIGSGPGLSATRLDALRLRWSNVRGGRQAASLMAVVTAALTLFLLLGALRGMRAAAGPALRIGGLAVMWWPTAVLFAAGVEPATRMGEVSLIAGISVALGVLTERTLPWTRAAALPAAVGLALYTADLAAGGELLTRSVLGPSVVSGSRFYGVSNELEPLLPIMLLVGLAAVLGGRAITRATTAIYLVAGLALLVVVGSGRLGADVGGVATVSVGLAVATLVMRPGAISRGAIALAVLAPVLALAGLIVLDLAVSGGSHLSRNLLRAGSPAEVAELFQRRYELSWGVLTAGGKLTHFVGALLAVAFAWRNRERLYAALPHRGWAAALAGGLAAGIAGALTNDSGPVLFINATIALAGVTAYLLGRPPAGTGRRTVAET